MTERASVVPPAGQGDAEPLHVSDEPVDLSDTPPEGWLALGLFWLLGLTVFHQFVTRYVLNDSAAWTEEIARYLLLGVVFVGASVGVIKDNHIQVDLLYRHLPRALGRVLSLGVDLLRCAFFLALVVLLAQLMLRLGAYEMTVAPVPMYVVYGVCELGLACMAWRSLHVLWLHWQRGHGLLDAPPEQH